MRGLQTGEALRVYCSILPVESFKSSLLTFRLPTTDFSAEDQVA